MNFQRLCVKYLAMVNHLSTHADCFAWAELGDRDTRYSTYLFASSQARVRDALANAAIRTVMPKFSKLHKDLAKSVSLILGIRCVTYEWLVKATARLLCDTDIKNLQKMCKISRAFRAHRSI